MASPRCTEYICANQKDYFCVAKREDASFIYLSANSGPNSVSQVRISV